MSRRTSNNTGKRQKSKTDANHLPAHIGEGFQRELVQLVDYLALHGGFREEYLREQLLTKYCDSTTTPSNVRKLNAILKWLGTERRNARTNQRLYLESANFSWGSSDEVLCHARKIIEEVLGSVGNFLPKLGRAVHTNGASTRVARSVVAAALKCTGEAEVTRTAHMHYLRAFNDAPRMPPCVEVVSSKLFTVPKNSEIDRVACKEPEANLLLQASVGAHIRRRLKKFGIDLRDQTRNQVLAQKASYGELRSVPLATIDLSSASDSLTRQLICNLLPVEWFVLLDDIRSHNVFVDYKDCFKGNEMRLEPETLHLEMFSSMGNGFTFELESLIFWALTRAVCRCTRTKGIISVYGDDIICPSKAVHPLVQLFGFCGFIVNQSKSYWTGTFRESCGKHYDYGSDVTPFYIRGPVRTKTDIIRLLNQLLKWDTVNFDGSTYAKSMYTKEIVDFHRRWSQVIPSKLHGGVDVEDITALVTGDRPRYRLARTKVTVERDEDGALTHWFMVTDLRSETQRGYFSVLSEEDGTVSLDDYNVFKKTEFDTKGTVEWYKEADLQVCFSVDNEEDGTWRYEKVPSYACKGSNFFYGKTTDWEPYGFSEESGAIPIAD